MENIILNSTTKLLKIGLDAATNPGHTIDITVSYVEISGSTLTDKAQETQATVAMTTALTTILDAPGLNLVRNALTVTVVNNDTVPHTYLYLQSCFVQAIILLLNNTLSQVHHGIRI